MKGERYLATPETSGSKDDSFAKVWFGFLCMAHFCELKLLLNAINVITVLFWGEGFLFLLLCKSVVRMVIGLKPNYFKHSFFLYFPFNCQKT